MKRFSLLFLLFLLIGCSDITNIKNIYGYVSDNEPNDDIKTATKVSSIQTIVGYFYKKDNKPDIDFYLISGLVANSSYDINITAVSGVDYKFSILDKSGRKLVIIDENFAGEGEKLWDFRPGYGEIYLKIETKTGFNKKIPYLINFSSKDVSRSDEIEPNNKIENSTIIFLNESKKGFISPKNDIDWYKIQIPSDSTSDFSIDVEPMSNLDVNFTLYNEKTGKYITIDYAGFGGNETIPYLSSSKGNYFVKVSGKVKDGKDEPSYFISVKELAGNAETESYYEGEENDSKETATEIRNNLNIKGVIFPDKDADYYYFILPKKALSIDISASRLKDIYPIIDLYDANGNLLKSSSSDHTIVNDLIEGKYYIKVTNKVYSLTTYNIFLSIRFK